MDVSELYIHNAFEGQKTFCDLQNWSYGMLLYTIWGLRTEPVSSDRATSAINHCTISLATS